MSVRALFARVTFAVTLVLARPAWSQPPQPQAPPKAAEPDPAALAEAKELFRQGVALFEVGEVEAALDKFMRSRAAFPSSRNTINAALSLQRLQRYDEALELYEQTIARYSNDLDDQDRRDVATALATLRDKVGTVDVSANVDGNLVVDGRARGKLPLPAPLRVVPGRHVLRVIKDGYSSYEVTFDIAGKERKQIDARLTALQAAGGLRIEDPGSPGADIVVDGAVVGTSPWEGSFAPGTHVVQSRSELKGSRPTQAIVVVGQTTLVRLKSEQLGPVVFFSASPTTAELALDGVPLGHGRWQGALPVGAYRVSANEEGYFTKEQRVDIQAVTRGTKQQRIGIELQIDPNHPRWPKRADGHFWVRAVAGFLIGPSLHSGPEGSCGSKCSGGPADGFSIGARVGYELPSKLSFELTAGYLSLLRTVDRQLAQPFPKGAPQFTTTYDLHDRLRVRGPMVSGGLSYRVPFGPHWSFSGRTSVGALFATSTDTLTGRASAGGDSVDVSIDGADQSVSSVALFVMPELGASFSFGAWQIGASLGAFYVPHYGPTLPRSQIAVAPACDSNRGAVGCTPVSTAIAGERAYGPFTMLTPVVSAGYTF